MTRRQSNNQWSGSIAAHPPPPQKKFWVQKSAGKALPLIFWDQDGVLLIDYLPNDQTINAEYYSSLLVQLKDILKEKRRGKVTKWSCSCTTIPRLTGHLQPRKKKKTGQPELPVSLDHPPYSPDLAPSDYHLFPGLKKQLEGRQFSSDAEVVAAAETWLDGQPSEFFFLSGLAKVRATG